MANRKERRGEKKRGNRRREKKGEEPAFQTGRATPKSEGREKRGKRKKKNWIGNAGKGGGEGKTPRMVNLLQLGIYFWGGKKNKGEKGRGRTLKKKKNLRRDRTDAGRFRGRKKKGRTCGLERRVQRPPSTPLV